MDKKDFDLSAMGRSELAELLEYHNRRYWDLNDPEISDARYDEIMEALKKLDPDHPLVNRIYTPSVAASGKVRHKDPMLSLDKAYTLEALLEWGSKFARTPDELLFIEPKYDGISASFDGRVLATRGDGEFGEDITSKLPLIELESTDHTGKLNRPARGELLIREDDFRTIYSNIRKKDGGIYKNSRNAVAGIMGLKDISDMLAQKAKITLVDYNLWKKELPLSRLEQEWEGIKEELAQLPYPQDGIVLKFADEAFRKSLGSTAHHPRGEIAYKFSNIRKRTKLIGVEWSFGKNCLTPVAQLEPVDISGTTIRRATLHNVENVLTLGVMIGDDVIVERAGDVIPHIVEVFPGQERKDPMIESCPECGTLLVRRGPELACPNRGCPATALQRIAAAVRCLGMDNIGGSTLKRLYEKGLIRNLRDLFDLAATDLLGIDGFAEKSAANTVKEIQKAKQVNDYQLLAAMNIPGIGINISKQILAEHTLAELRTMQEEELSALPGIGPERAVAIRQAFSGNAEELDELLSAVTPIQSKGSSAGGLKTVCFTGKMPEKRSYYEKLAAEHGFLAVDTVSRELSILVAADPAASGGKLDKARKYGVSIMALDDFLSSLNNDAVSQNVPAEAEQDLLPLMIPEEDQAGSDDQLELFPVQGELF